MPCPLITAEPSPISANQCHRLRLVHLPPPLIKTARRHRRPLRFSLPTACFGSRHSPVPAVPAAYSHLSDTPTCATPPCRLRFDLEPLPACSVLPHPLSLFPAINLTLRQAQLRPQSRGRRRIPSRIGLGPRKKKKTIPSNPFPASARLKKAPILQARARHYAPPIQCRLELVSSHITVSRPPRPAACSLSCSSHARHAARSHPPLHASHATSRPAPPSPAGKLHPRGLCLYVAM